MLGWWMRLILLEHITSKSPTWYIFLRFILPPIPKYDLVIAVIRCLESLDWMQVKAYLIFDVVWYHSTLAVPFQVILVSSLAHHDHPNFSRDKKYVVSVSSMICSIYRFLLLTFKFIVLALLSPPCLSIKRRLDDAAIDPPLQYNILELATFIFSVFLLTPNTDPSRLYLLVVHKWTLVPFGTQADIPM